ncbi:hypothetical protein [Streptomyces sp. NPDC057838]|uniref:hypothetical protein n=1 Tax=unclassified Streptomyces TaxID=2593676 RepID=UPI0036B87D9B
MSSALLVAMTLTLTGALTAQRALVIVAVVSTVATLAPPWRRAGHSGPGDG